ncbi:MAG: SDR family oxidoreductase [Acidobacteriota bacterium]
MTPSGPVEDFSALHPVVLGSDGRAGGAIAQALSKVAPNTVAATRTELDITDYFGLRWELERLEADLVVNAAGWSDPDRCEGNRLGAFQVNGEGAGHAARAAAAVGARFVHLSSFHIFDGRKGSPYTEKDAPAPLSVHGRSKLGGEMKVVEAAPGALIVRTAWLFGGRGRYPDLVERVLAAAAAAGEVVVAGGRRGSPTLVDDLAAEILLLIGLGAHGIVHLTGGGDASEVDFAREVLELAGQDRSRVTPRSGEAHDGAALWPQDGRLDTSRFRQYTGSSPRHWRKALAELMARRGQGSLPGREPECSLDPVTGPYGPH